MRPPTEAASLVLRMFSLFDLGQVRRTKRDSSRDSPGQNSRLGHSSRNLGHRGSNQATTKAFLNVPLYSAIFENYKAGVLPPAAALERDLIGLEAAEKQTGRARQIFERSAE
jgi:hypothetical protein